MDIEISQDVIDTFQGMEEVYAKECERLDAMAPVCHFRKMTYETADNGNGGTESWWECSVCGHTKSL